MSLLFAYLIAISFVSVTLLFFYFWKNGRYLNIILLTLLSRILVGYINEKTAFLFGSVEVDEFLEYYERWQSLNEFNLLAPFYKSQENLDLHKGSYASYNILNGLIVQLSGKDNLFPLRIYLISIGIWLIFPLVKLSEAIFKSPPSVLNVLLATNFPSWVRHSVTVGRTELSMFLTVYAFTELYLLLFDKFTYARLFKVIILNWLMIVFRNWFIAFTICTLVLFFVIKFLQKGNVITKVILTLLVFQLASLAYNLTLGKYTFEDMYAVQDFINNTDTNFGGSSYLVGVVPNSIYDIVWYLPLHGFYFLFSPMIWDVNNINHLISCFMSFSFLCLIIIALIRNVKHKINNNINWILIIFFSVACILGAGVKNAGAAERWRTPIVLSLVLLCLETNRKFNSPK